MKNTKALAAALCGLLLCSCGNIAEESHKRSAEGPHDVTSQAVSEQLTDETEKITADSLPEADETTTASEAAVTTEAVTTTAAAETTTIEEITAAEATPTQVTESEAVEIAAEMTTSAQAQPEGDDSSLAANALSTEEGYTSNGKKIEVKDGLTYIDGILIVNKSFPLPADYNPGGLMPEAQQAFNEFQASAANDGVWLYIVSGFRSYEYQDYLYNNYYSYRGEETDRFSARAGYSEHQSGLAMDLNNASRSFVGTPEAAYIAAHCAEFGFIIRYPDEKEYITGFMYEPWHLRYVGKELAAFLTDSGLTLEEYLGVTSKYAEDEAADDNAAAAAETTETTQQEPTLIGEITDQIG